MAWLKDPLVLFVVFGAALAALHVALRDEAPALDRQTEIVVTDADVARLRQVFEKTWQRPPTDAEVRILVDRRVRDEILYREAVALGLDQGDDALRRRLVLRLEFLARDAGGIAIPSEAELRVFLETNAASYARTGSRSFVHVFVSEERGGEKAAAEAEALLGRLRSGPRLDPGTLGDRILLEAEQTHVAPHDVKATFGGDFAKAVFEQEIGVWGGPLRSSYGLHLVLVRDEVPGSAPPFEDVRDKLRRDLVARRGEEALRAYVEVLRRKYDVSIRATLGSDGDE